MSAHNNNVVHVYFRDIYGITKYETCLVTNDENGQNNYKEEKSPTHQFQNELIRNKLFLTTFQQR